MNLKEFIKPTTLKILIFLIIGVLYLYFAGESVCGASFAFTFCYKAYGFPFSYIVTGNIDTASGYIKTLFLGKYFSNSGNILFNPAALILNLILIYISTCFAPMLFKK